MTVRFPLSIASAIVAQAVAEAPLEACGILVGSAPWADDGRPLRYVPCRNCWASPTRFEAHPDDLRRVLLETDRAGEVFWAIVHSHVRTPAVPSPTDIGQAPWWPGSLWVLISLAADQADPLTGAPSVRCWSIDGAGARELPLEIE